MIVRSAIVFGMKNSVLILRDLCQKGVDVKEKEI